MAVDHALEELMGMLGKKMIDYIILILLKIILDLFKVREI